jgi:branched-chain amino acid aminotransferase
MEELAPAVGLRFCEERLARYDIYVADECFLTGTGAELIPVIDLDGRRIGEGTPGLATRRLARGLRELAERAGSPVF